MDVRETCRSHVNLSIWDRSLVPPLLFSSTRTSHLSPYLSLPPRLCFSKFHRQRMSIAPLVYTHIDTSLSFSVPSFLSLALDRQVYLGEHRRAAKSRTWRSCGRGGREFRVLVPVTVTVLVALQNRVAAAARNYGLMVLQWITVL